VEVNQNQVKLTHSLYFAASALLPPPLLYRLPLPFTAASVSALFIGISDKHFSIKNNKNYRL
jgi:hypothetical protein